MAATWSLVGKTANTNLGYYYHPAAWEDSGKVYVKGQGELDINIYTVATDSWSSITMQSTNHTNSSGDYYVKSEQVCQELIWVANNKIYLMLSTWVSSVGAKPYLYSLNISTAARISTWDLTTPCGSLTGDTAMHGNWGRNRHKAVVKDETSGRIFVINFYTKQIGEFYASTETFAIVKTWSETVGGVSTDDATGCSAVCVNGTIYIMGKHSYGASSGGIAGPLAIDTTTWESVTGADYPDYGEIGTQTYKHYCNAQWVAIGNSIYGYGGQLQSTENADGSGTSQSAGNLLRKVAYNTVNDSWSDFSTITDAHLYSSTVGYNAVGFFLGGYIGGSATQVTNQLTYLPTPASGVGVSYSYSGKVLTVNWSYEDTDPDAFMLDYKLSTDTEWSTEYLCGQIPGNARAIAISYLATSCDGDTCYSITYTYDDISTETVAYATSNFNLTALDLESSKYLFRLTPVVVVK